MHLFMIGKFSQNWKFYLCEIPCQKSTFHSNFFFHCRIRSMASLFYQLKKDLGFMEPKLMRILKNLQKLNPSSGKCPVGSLCWDVVDFWLPYANL